MKIGSLEFKSYATKKPLMITSEGQFVTVKQVAETPSLGMGSLFALDEKLQIKLAIERYSSILYLRIAKMRRFEIS